MEQVVLSGNGVNVGKSGAERGRNSSSKNGMTTTAPKARCKQVCEFLAEGFTILVRLSSGSFSVGPGGSRCCQTVEVS